MTTNQLRKKMNDEFGMGPRPKKYEVDAETYGNVCNGIINYIADEMIQGVPQQLIMISIGPNKGVYFQNIELVLKP